VLTDKGIRVGPMFILSQQRVCAPQPTVYFTAHLTNSTLPPANYKPPMKKPTLPFNKFLFYLPLETSER